MITDPAQRLKDIKTYYFSAKLQEISRLKAEGRSIINLGIGNPDLAPHPEIVRKLTESASAEDVHGYQGYRGTPVLREAIARHSYDYYETSPDPDREILPLIGSKEGLMHLAQAFINPGDLVLVPDPGYATYAAVTKLAEGIPVPYHLTAETKWQPDLQALRKLPLERVKLMWLNYPNMPTGTPPDREILANLVNLAREYRFLLVNDNPYSALFSGKPFSIMQVPGVQEVAVELNSLSKSHQMAGWRIGWLSGREEYIQTVLKVKSNMDSGMFRPLQEAAATALALPHSYYGELRTLYKGRREMAFTLARLLNCTFTTNQEGMFVWAALPAHRTSEEFTDFLLEATEVFVTPGFIFGPAGDQYIRISLCQKENLLQEAAERVKKINI